MQQEKFKISTGHFISPTAAALAVKTKSSVIGKRHCGRSLWKSPPSWPGSTLHCVLMAVDMIVPLTQSITRAGRSDVYIES